MAKHLLMTAALLIPAAAHAEKLNVANITFEKPALTEITPDWLSSTKTGKHEQLEYLRKLESDNGFAPGTFRIKWVIESRAGELNIKNKKGYKGHFQYGKYEWNKYCKVGSPFNFKDAADCLPKFLDTYYRLSASYTSSKQPRNALTPMDWYHLHQQGYRGAGEQYEAAVHNKPISRTVLRNMKGNVPKVYKSVLFPVTDQQTFAQMFYKLWDTESFRIWTAIKDADE